LGLATPSLAQRLGGEQIVGAKSSVIQNLIGRVTRQLSQKKIPIQIKDVNVSVQWEHTAPYKETADMFMERVAPEDSIYWEFDSDREYEKVPDLPIPYKKFRNRRLKKSNILNACIKNQIKFRLERRWELAPPTSFAFTDPHRITKRIASMRVELTTTNDHLLYFEVKIAYLDFTVEYVVPNAYGNEGEFIQSGFNAISHFTGEAFVHATNGFTTYISIRNDHSEKEVAFFSPQPNDPDTCHLNRPELVEAPLVPEKW
jgi:hypothetical protein